MKFWVSENEKIKKQAGDDMVIFLGNWKKKVKRYRIYRRCLAAALSLGVMALVGLGYYRIDSSIPSMIYVRAGEEQSFQLGVPAKAEIISASGQGESNIPSGAVSIDLNKKVTMKADWSSEYQMQVRLFGFLPFKQMGISVIEDQELIPMGVPVGIYMKTDGIMVIGTGEFTGQDGAQYSPSKYILRSGDYIRKLNGAPVSEKDDFIRRIEESEGKELLISIRRNGELMELNVKPVKDQNGAYRIGAWVRDNTQGVGTLTYIDGDGNFGALGHGINDVDTNDLMKMDDGTLYQTEIVSIHKGGMGKPGEMVGMIVYSDERILGDIKENSRQGIFGKYNQKISDMVTAEPMPIALKQEITEGPAQILCTVDGTTQYYDIEITGIHLDRDNVNRGLELKVTDPELLEITGGIIQGMSGAPIIQNGKIVGAVTHVLVQDSSKGYGIFIEKMLLH